MFRDRRWLDLLTLIDWLPRNCAYIEALSEDDEVAEEVLRQPENQKPRGAAPRISEWSPELERMTDLLDRMGEVMIAVVASQGGKAPKIRPAARPRTAIDRMRERKRYEHHRKTVARVLVQKSDGTEVPIALAGAPQKPVPKPVLTPEAASADRPVLLPGEDPFRLKAPRTRPDPPPGGAITGEPKKPVT
jgi:hypothetical protein